MNSLGEARYTPERIIAKFPVGSKWYHFNFHNVQDGNSKACVTEIEVTKNTGDLLIEYRHLQFYADDFRQVETYQNFKCNSFENREECVKAIRETYISNILEFNIKISKQIEKLANFNEEEELNKNL